MHLSHSWTLTPKEAIALQKELRSQIRLIPLNKPIQYIAGADVSMSLYSKTGFAGFVVLKYPELELVETSVVKDELKFPYIPGLLSFREIPSLLKAWANLKVRPDLIIVDGIGIAHPRRLGIASHLGLALNIPTIGCAKSILIGKYKEPGNEAGSFTYLYDKTEIIGAALRTKKNVKPVFVSPGHKITLEESVKVVLNCIKKHRLPEPTRLAHNAMNEERIKNNA